MNSAKNGVTIDSETGHTKATGMPLSYGEYIKIIFM
jgi:hypothetical protein